MPTIHVNDLAACVRRLADAKEGFGSKQYFFAVDQCTNRTQTEIMKAISTKLGNGAIKNVALSDVVQEDWSEMLCLNAHLHTSPEFLNIKWHCREGINDNSMKMLNEEFNSFRGLFPLKVYIGGPAFSGKSHFASRLASGYGIPHLHISEMLAEAKQAGDQLANDINKKIEELKDIEVAAYEKTKKKKDPDIDRNSLKPRIPDDML